ncbi:MAG: Ala-tRNA(Pro) hydrolase [Stappia sp.]|uniref:alanyl-tRNA editing protein n=1 Tax=Stappia sp. TaxID=1870903 RepID=UPI000C4A3CA8|nr:alanyl-tRNA editing protein [Stappia sp.]MAA98584.1 Ala-tRNA(Pro) hydrolase [Stappia sp.]MBM20587.1 Ala-tRNA(Pro) hydrolase [Stappia sp.]
MTDLLFRDDAYLRTCEATVTGVNDRGGVLLDRTIFYATGGGQPGDTGHFELSDGRRIDIATTVYGETKSEIVHVPAEGQELPATGDKVVLHLDWERRYKLMRVHTALHLLSVVLPYPVTGGQIGEGDGRLDFDLPEMPMEKEEIASRLNEIAAADHGVSTEWITDEELLAKPEMVKTMSVKPPMGSGHVRLVRIGDVDLQPCGGTHVSRTSEIGQVAVTKVEKKGRQNRRVRISLAD